MFGKLYACYNAVFVDNKILQNVEFLFSKTDGGVIKIHQPVSQVYFKAPYFHHILFQAMFPPYNGLHERRKFKQGEWFCQVIVSTQVKPFNFIVSAATSS